MDTSGSYSQPNERNEGYEDKRRVTRHRSLPRLPDRSVMNLPNISIGSFVQEKYGIDDLNVGATVNYSEGSKDSASAPVDGYGEIKTMSNGEKKGQKHVAVAPHDDSPNRSDSDSADQERSTHTPRRHKVWGNLPKEEDSTSTGSVFPTPVVGPRITPSHPQHNHSLTARPILSNGAAASHGSDTITTLPASEHLPSIGKWRCCKCTRGHSLYAFDNGLHPVSILNCLCTHRSCVNCALEGPHIKPFHPMREPVVIHLSDDHAPRLIRFGVFCDGCGLSWRAQEVRDDNSRKTGNGNSSSALLQRISAMPRSLVRKGLYPLRHSRSLSHLTSSSSSSNSAVAVEKQPLLVSGSSINLRQLSSEMEKGHGKQADVTSVRFTAIKCTCGLVTDTGSLCFQVVSAPLHKQRSAGGCEDRLDEEAEVAGEKRKVFGGFTTTPVYWAKGHGQPVLHLKGGEHPNPLRSAPVKVDDLE